MNSEIHGFHKKTSKERRQIIKDEIGLSSEEINTLEKFGALKEEDSNQMIENVV